MARWIGFVLFTTLAWQLGCASCGPDSPTPDSGPEGTDAGDAGDLNERDAGLPDAATADSGGFDAGTDGGADGGLDGGTDSGTPDSGWDGGSDAGVARWRAIAGENLHACAIAADRSLWCWGFNGSGELGTSPGTSSTVPRQVGTFLDWAAVGSGQWHTCAIRDSGELYCWGSNAWGQLGDAGLYPETSTPTRIGPPVWRTLGLGWTHSCAIQDGGSLWCWGSNSSGQLGHSQDHWSPGQVGAEQNWTAVSLGSASSCGIRSDTTLWCWGANVLGNGQWGSSSTPSQVDGGWTTVAVGNDHACALSTTDGGLSCWGFNASGELGDGTTTGRNTPGQVALGGGCKYVSAGGSHTCAIRTDGSLWCWGSNAYGQLGLGFVGPGTATPVRVGTETDWEELSLFRNTSCGLRAGGTLWCWGDNAEGQLGDGTKIRRVQPTFISR
jgi:alpha-tubulin suppressor-like RCC1 family protein